MPVWWRDPVTAGLPAAAAPGLEACVWGAGQLSREQRRYLASLPATTTLRLGLSGDLLAFHGSPRSAGELVMAETPASQLDEMFADAGSASILAGGHTHVPLVRRYRQQTIVNAGAWVCRSQSMDLPAASTYFRTPHTPSW